MEKKNKNKGKKHQQKELDGVEQESQQKEQTSDESKEVEASLAPPQSVNEDEELVKAKNEDDKQENNSNNATDQEDSFETPNLSDEIGDVGSLGSLDANDEDHLGGEDGGDTWIEELECALLADCDPATLKKISEGKRIPSTLRPDYWRTLLAVDDAGKVKLTREYDLENQIEIRQDCERLVNDIAENLAIEPMSEAERLRLLSDFESTLTTYVKARPELNYCTDNGWTDILKVLYHLELSDIQLYQMFFRIVDRYIPKDLSFNDNTKTGQNQEQDTNSRLNPNSSSSSSISKNCSGKNPLPKVQSAGQLSIGSNASQQDGYKKSIQAYHLLRLLIQYHDPELCSILDSWKVTPNIYVKDWFCSLFARSCSPKLALLIWDTHFRMADPFLIFFAAIVMVVNASDELKRKNITQKEMLSVLKVMPSKLEEDDIEDMYYLVSNHYTNSTPRSIRSYSHLFFMDTFGNTYSGNDSPEDGRPLTDVKTSRLTHSLDLSQYLCLPIVPAEIFALDTAHLRNSPTHNSSLRYFLVDCRPAEQYNAGHLTKAFHLDCSLMLREPSSFATAVQALLEIQRQVVASKSNTGGQHLCFIGSGQEEEDQYVNMVVASFLQKYQKYVSIVVGGFDAIHDYVKTKSELKGSFDKYIVDHNPDLCKACCSRSPEAMERLKSSSSAGKRGSKSQSGEGVGGLSSALFASTTSFLRGDKGASFTKLATGPQATATASMLAQSGASMLDKFTTAFVSKSSVIKDRLVETLNTTAMPAAASVISSSSSTGFRSHVSSQDKLGRRYTGSNTRYAIDEDDQQFDGMPSSILVDPNDLKKGSIASASADEPVQEIQIDVWQRQTKLLAFYKCAQIKGNTKYPGYVALTKTHLWILREIPHNKGFATIAAKRPLDMVVQITSKRRQPDLIIFRYGYANQARSSDTTNNTTTTTTSMDTDNSTASATGDSNEDIKQETSKTLPSIVASDQLHIPQAFELIRLIKREILRIMDESSRGSQKQERSPGVGVDVEGPDAGAKEDAASPAPSEGTSPAPSNSNSDQPPTDLATK